MFPSTAGKSSHSSSGIFGCPTGASSNWAFGQTSSPLSSTTTFGAPSYSGFGNPTTAALGHSSSSSFGTPWVFMQGNQKGDPFALKALDSTNVFGYPIGMSNSHGTSTWTFGQTSSLLSTSTTTGAPSSYGLGNSTPGGNQATKSTFNLKQLHCGGQERGSRIADYKRTAEAASSAQKLVSISAMPVYKAKSHEELRCEDYKFTGKGGFGFSSSAIKSTSSGLSPFNSSSVTSFPTTSPVAPNPFGKTFPSVAMEKSTWKYPGPTTTSLPLPFSSSANNTLTTVTTAPLNSFDTFVPRTNLTFPTSIVSSVSLPSLDHDLTNPFNSDSKPSSLNALWSSPIGGPSNSIVTAAANSASVSPVTSGLSSSFNQPTTLFKPSVPFTQSCNGDITVIIGQSSVGQLSSSQVTSTEQPSYAASPFGTLSPKPQKLVFEGCRSTQSIQYGISSMPVKDKPAPVRYPLLTTRHFSRKSKLPVRKYDPKLNGPKIPYFSDTKEMPVAVYVPRENPRALVVSPDMWPPRAITENMHEEKFSNGIYENERDDIRAYRCSDDPTDKKEVFARIPDVPSKLQQPDYYTEPRISELEAKERAGPGFCGHVKNFMVGRRGYGSINFLGETDVRNIDIETHVQFNNREVIVYMDENKKPPIGEGLNKPAEITLLNIKCIDKRSGMQYMKGSNIDKYTTMLKKRAVAQGAEFISYDPVEGEWKFRVQHF